jgi:hypothetical protein
VARFAVGDATHGQELEAQDLVKRCSECAALAADIRSISKSVARMPAPRRERDFRLTTEQAAQLRGSRIDRWLRSITGSGWSTVRPVAAVALSIGMVMSVVGFLPVIGAASGGTSALQPVGVPSLVTDRSDEVPAPAASGAGSEFGPNGKDDPMGSPASGNMDNAYLTQESAAPGGAGQSDGIANTQPGRGPSVSDVLLLSGLAVTVLAFLVLALLYAARRRYYDPLLR